MNELPQRAVKIESVLFDHSQLKMGRTLMDASLSDMPEPKEIVL